MNLNYNNNPIFNDNKFINSGKNINLKEIDVNGDITAQEKNFTNTYSLDLYKINKTYI